VKKFITCIFACLIFATACGRQNNIERTLNNHEGEVQEQTSTNKSDEEKRQIIMNYALSQELQNVYLAVPKYYFKKCPIDSQEYPACYADIIRRDGNTKVYATGNQFVDPIADREITFNLSGDCKNSSSCYATIKSIKTGYSVKVPLKIDSMGYLATKKKYSMEEFKKICKENKK
jgi:hypothetical protein